MAKKKKLIDYDKREKDAINVPVLATLELVPDDLMVIRSPSGTICHIKNQRHVITDCEEYLISYGVYARRFRQHTEYYPDGMQRYVHACLLVRRFMQLEKKNESL